MARNLAPSGGGFMEPSPRPKATKVLKAYRNAGKPGPNFYVVLLGLKTFDTRRLIESVERGFSYSTFEHFQRNSSLPLDKLSDLVQIPLRTLTRRKAGGRLLPEESDRLLRASRVFGRALELFEGDDEAARSWLVSPQPALGGAA